MGSRTTTKPDRPRAYDHLPPKQARRGSVAILFSEDAAERLAAAETALVIASDEGRAVAQAELDAARAEVEEHTVVYRFCAMGQPAYQALVTEHPPTAEQMADHRRRVEEEAAKPLGEREPVEAPFANPETFAPALIAASLYDPAMTLEEVRVEFSRPEWNIAEVQALYDEALRVNTTMRRVPAGKGSGSTRG